MSRRQKLAAEYATANSIDGFRARFLLQKGFLAGYAACEQDAKVMEEGLEFYAKDIQQDGIDSFYAECPLGWRARQALAKWKERGE